MAGSDSSNHLIQLLPDGQAQILQMMEDGSGVLQTAQALTEGSTEPLAPDSTEPLTDGATEGLGESNTELLPDDATAHLTDEANGPKVICIEQIKSEGSTVDDGQLDSSAAVDEQQQLVIQETRSLQGSLVDDEESVLEAASDDGSVLPQTNEEMNKIQLITMPDSSGGTRLQIITCDGEQMIDGLAPVKDTPGPSLLVGDQYAQPQITISAAGTSLLRSNITSSVAESISVSELEPTLVSPVTTKEEPMDDQCNSENNSIDNSIPETEESQGSNSGAGDSNQGNKDSSQNTETISATSNGTDAADSTPSSSQSTDTSQPAATTQEDAKPVMKVIDTSSPISLTCETVVVIDGKKCVLRVDPNTNHLVAYPYKIEGGKSVRFLAPEL